MTAGGFEKGIVFDNVRAISQTRSWETLGSVESDMFDGSQCLPDSVQIDIRRQTAFSGFVCDLVPRLASRERVGLRQK